MAQIKVTPIDKLGTDLSVVNAARVSFGKTAPHMREQDKRLIRYLAEHDHISPFGHCFASFHVKAPVFVARQLVKHKFLRWNEVSRRYVDDEPEFFYPEGWRKRAENVKQGSDSEYVPDNEYLDGLLERAHEDVRRWYEDLLHAGVAPEQARMVLPQNTMTEWYWSGSLDAFADMVVLRTGEDAQEESRMVAEQISEHMAEWFPMSWEALVYEK